MNVLDEKVLAEIGFAAAALVPGLGDVEQVEGTTDLDPTDGELIYAFTFLIESGRDPERRGISRIRLGQRLRDKLEERKDEHYPFVRILNRAEWERRKGA